MLQSARFIIIYFWGPRTLLFLNLDGARLLGFGVAVGEGDEVGEGS